MIVYLIKGVIIGLVCGTPIGAAGAMTIQRTLKYGRKQGLLTGLGSSIADCIFAGVGVFGLTFVSDFLSVHKSLVSIFGGAIVIFLGLSMFRKKETVYKTGDGFRYFLSTFIVGITNPVMIITFLIAFSYMNIHGVANISDGVLAILGVFIGTYAWWCVLAHLTYLVKKKSRQDILDKVNTVLSCVLIILGIAMIIKGIVQK